MNNHDKRQKTDSHPSSQASNHAVALQELQLLYKDRFTTSPEDLSFYGKDWTTYFEVRPLGIVFPVATDEVVKTVGWANKHKIGLVPSGGRTGLSGGACALNGEIVVSLEKMNRILAYDSIDSMVEIEAGVVTETLQKFALEKNRFYPVDFAARGSSQMGGNIATNAGGIKVVRYGMTRRWIMGLEVVTGTGKVLNLNHGLVKNATGPDLSQVFIGSEGILGFVTKALVQLTAPPKPSTVLLISTTDLKALMGFFALLKEKVTLNAFEMFSDIAMSKVIEEKGLSQPFSGRSPFYAVVEVETSSAEDMNQLEESFTEALEKSYIVDGLISQSEEQAKTFWRYREDISESLAPHSPYKNDVSVRVSLVPEFIDKLDLILSKHYPTWTVVWFGHIGDGNLHINILRPKDMEKGVFVAECRKVDKLIFEIIQSLDGSISAEHGLGLTKKDFLNFSRSSDEIEYLRELKNIFDPNGILNPGKCLPDVGFGSSLKGLME